MPEHGLYVSLPSFSELLEFLSRLSGCYGRFYSSCQGQKNGGRGCGKYPSLTLVRMALTAWRVRLNTHSRGNSYFGLVETYAFPFTTNWVCVENKLGVKRLQFERL